MKKSKAEPEYQSRHHAAEETGLNVGRDIIFVISIERNERHPTGQIDLRRRSPNRHARRENQHAANAELPALAGGFGGCEGRLRHDFFRPEGPRYDSPGQRPGERMARVSISPVRAKYNVASQPLLRPFRASGF